MPLEVNRLRFRNRREGGRLLAERLRRYSGAADAMVLGLPRGGVVVACEIAVLLDLPLDVLVVRKLGTPGHEELAMGAIAPGGVRILNHDVIGPLHIGQQDLDRVAEREERELQRRESLFRAGRPPLAIEGRTVIVVDDGLATGSTMLAAIESIRARKPAGIVLAVPVAPPETCERFRREVTDLVCLSSPAGFGAVGEWYDDFAQVSDREVIDLLHEAAARHAEAGA
jgi:putative phosphoribosyl transferase